LETDSSYIDNSSENVKTIPNAGIFLNYRISKLQTQKLQRRKAGRLSTHNVNNQPTP